MQFLIPIVAILSVFGSISWVVYLIVDAVRTRHRLRMSAEFHGKLLERIGSARELGEFLSTEGGRTFLDSLTEEKGPAPQLRILRALQSGIVLVMLGLGLFIAIRRGLPAELDPGLTIFATVALALGLGLMVSSAASYALSKRMGLLAETARARHVMDGTPSV